MSNCQIHNLQSVFTCNRDEISSWDETPSGIKNLIQGCLHLIFPHDELELEFHLATKFGLKEDCFLSMKTYEIYNFFFKLLKLEA